jgi:hypothetical protein
MHAARMGKMIQVHKVGEPEGKSLFGRRKRRWKDNSITDIKKKLRA